MKESWRVAYFKDEKGSVPVKEFFELPSVIGITEGEKKVFKQRLKWVRQRGLGLAERRGDVLEHLKNEGNLYSLRIPSKPNNPRVLLCSIPGSNQFALLHAFKEKNSRDYKRAISVAKGRRDRLLATVK